MHTNMSDLENCMVSIINVFHKYSGHKCHLKKAELKALINNEMTHFINKVQDNETLDELFADLDQNGDLEIDFKEFIALIAMTNMSELEKAMVSIINVFHKYSGHKCHLKKTELKDLINYEMKHLIKKVEDEETLHQLFSDLDKNGDMKIDLQEFLTLIAKVISACHDAFSVHH